MRSSTRVLVGLLGLAASTVALSDSLEDARITIYDERFHRFIDAESQVEILAEGLGWAEGPVWVDSLDALLFSDVAADTIYRWDETGGLRVYVHPSGHAPDDGGAAWRGSNGLALDRDGSLLLAQQGNRRLARMTAPVADPAPEYAALVSQYRGKSINSPNDLVVHPSGDIYFTDPPYGLAGFEQSPDLELDFFGVFRLTPGNELHLVNRNLEKPNGIALSNDGATLYVSNSEPGKAQIIAIELDHGGMPPRSRLFFDAMQQNPDGPGSTDGMTMHPEDYLFVSLPGGFGILSPNGELLGTISLGQITNLAFDDTLTYLYLTSPGRLLRLKINNTRRPFD